MLKKLKDRGWFYLFIVILVVSTVIRVIYCLKAQGPRMYGDELLYRRGSATLFYEHKYYDITYPMGYCLVISLSYLFKDFYRAIQGINIGLFLLGNIAVWKILRMFINEKGSVYGILLVSLFPSQYVWCSQLMSENLYYPLLMWTLYLFLWIFNQQKIKYGYCLGLGVMIASLHLTRHITIVLLPVFALCWFLDLKESGKWRLVLSKDRFIKGICVLLGYTAIYGSWVAYWLYNKENIDKILGFRASKGLGLATIKEYATVKSLFIFVILYLGYVILAMPYEFPMETKGFIKCIRGGYRLRWQKQDAFFGERD